MNGWPIVPLGQALRQRKEFITISDLETYKRCRVQLHAQGIVLRDILPGAEIKTKAQQVCRAGEFLVAEIDAKVGGYGLVPDALDGAIVSSHYFLFVVDRRVLDLRFLDYFCRTPGFQEQVTAKGTTNYAAIRPSDVLSYKIPLPPLDEQRRIVARIEELAGKIEEARGLRRETESAVLVLAASVLSDQLSRPEGAVKHSLGEVFDFRYELIHPHDGSKGPLTFIGLQHIEAHTGKRTGEEVLLAEQLDGRKFRFSPGEIVYGYLRPYLNKVWIADREGICSVDQYVLRPKPQVIDTRYLALFMRSRPFVQQAVELTNNLLLPRLRSGLLGNTVIPLPPLAAQRRIVDRLEAVLTQLDELKQHHAATAAELDALLPSILDRAFKGELV
jgi:type I restriction enzyme, S subunit